MEKKKRKKLTRLFSGLLGLVLVTTFGHSTYVSSQTKSQPSKQLIKLRIIETTDVHANLLSYDYKHNIPNKMVGFARSATLIKKARAEETNSVLVDNGDLIQGTPLATYKAIVAPLTEGEVHPIFRAMNTLNYDIATLGNHEFNYGLDFLEEVYNDANFPIVNANVYIDDHDKNPENDKNKFIPYRIIKRKLRDENGRKHVLKIGYIGFVPPRTNEWDKEHLQGKVVVKDIVKTAQKFIPEMKKKGADIIIALAHSGFSNDKNDKDNVVYFLSKIPGIDAITFSHTHKIFPAKSKALLDPSFLDSKKKPLPGVDNKIGRINGVPAVQAGSGGGSIGIIDLQIEKTKDKWTVVDSNSHTREIWKNVMDPVTNTSKLVSVVKPDKDIVKLVHPYHLATIKYLEAAKKDLKN